MIMPTTSPIAQPVRQCSVALSATADSAPPEVGSAPWSWFAWCSGPVIRPRGLPPEVDEGHLGGDPQPLLRVDVRAAGVVLLDEDAVAAGLGDHRDVAVGAAVADHHRPDR